MPMRLANSELDGSAVVLRNFQTKVVFGWNDLVGWDGIDLVLRLFGESG